MTSTGNRNRQSPGQPTGGQFAAEVKSADTGVDLDPSAGPGLDVPPPPGGLSERDEGYGHHHNPAARYARSGQKVELDRKQVSVERVDHPDRLAEFKVTMGGTTVTMNGHRASDYEDTIRARREGRFWARRAEADGELRGLADNTIPVKQGDWVVCDAFSDPYTLPDEDYQQVFSNKS